MKLTLLLLVSSLYCIFNIFSLFLFLYFLADETIDDLIGLSTKDDGWTFVGEEKGVRIHKTHSEDNPVVM